MIAGKRPPRLLLRLVFLAAAGVLLWPVPSRTGWLNFVVQASPFAAICTTIAIRHLAAGTIVGLALAVVAAFRQRFFCRFICPTGLLVDAVSSAGLRRSGWWSKFPPIGRYAALLTLFGAVVGYPVLLWMDPLAILSSAFAIPAAGFVSGLGIGCLIILSITSGPLWCSRLCPLGAAQDLLASARSLFRRRRMPCENPVPLRRAFIVAAAGIGLGLVAKRLGAARGENAPLRPPGAVDEDIFTGRCVRCGNCIRVCPSRILHADTGEAGIAGLLAPIVRYERRHCLEDCNRCTTVCPSGAIANLDLAGKRSYVIGEALVDFELCLTALAQKDCDACEIACPYDAVHIHWDEDQYVAYPVIDKGKCNGCGACEVACPSAGYKAIRVWRLRSPG